MKSCKCGKLIWFILGVVGLLALLAPLVYAIVRVDKIPGLVIDKDVTE